ncbi:Protein kinase subdomain-containing protein PKL/CAK/Fmp29 [Mycena kentingensis (nom. inval.)]|nr:Protein kinase subdomain-containing protein PKL/CAK/Fmp29 [Mycena kentingensis (nom. inval.)]
MFSRLYSRVQIPATRFRLYNIRFQYRSLSGTRPARHDLFDYTSGRWLYNEALRLKERRRPFNVDGLRRLAAQSVNRHEDDIVELKKVFEGEHDRTLLITMRDGFQMVARIPYPLTVPKYLGVASEVATMEFMRTQCAGIPIPDVFGYAPDAENVAETPYILMEHVEGTRLSDMLLELDERDIDSLTEQFARFEAEMMEMAFPAGGSLYFTDDLKGVADGILLDNPRFSVGPETRDLLWYGKRSEVISNRGPYDSAVAAFTSGARKEIAYLENFGKPLLPFTRERRALYNDEPQKPETHLHNLRRFLEIAPLIVPSDPTGAHTRFRIRHPDLHPQKLLVSRSPETGTLNIVAITNWHATALLPMFLQAGFPSWIKNHGDPVSDALTNHLRIGEKAATPVLPADYASLDVLEQQRAMQLYHKRLFHHHYFMNTGRHNDIHLMGLYGPHALADGLRRRMFRHSSWMWEGEPLLLRVVLVQAMQNWETTAAAEGPCPLEFDEDYIRETMDLYKAQQDIDQFMSTSFRDLLNFALDGWVENERYEVISQLMAQAKSPNSSETDERDYPFNDMDESPYL